MSVLLIVTTLTACSQPEEKNEENNDIQMTTEQVSPKNAVPHHQAEKTSSLLNNQRKAYKEAVTQYTVQMNEVINAMTTTMSSSTAQQQYDRTKDCIKQYETQKKSAQPPQDLKEVEETIDEANTKYLGAMEKIVQGIEENDEEKKMEGFQSFSQAHQYFNQASFAMAADTESSTEVPSTELPSTEQSIEKEVYTAETTEAPLNE